MRELITCFLILVIIESRLPTYWTYMKSIIFNRLFTRTEEYTDLQLIRALLTTVLIIFCPKNPGPSRGCRGGKIHRARYVYSQKTYFVICTKLMCHTTYLHSQHNEDVSLELTDIVLNFKAIEPHYYNI